MQNPSFPLPSATTIRNRLATRIETFQEGALSRLPDRNKVAISLDGWSSSTRLSFLGIIAHYISKDWVLIEELIGFESLEDVHSGAVLAKVVNTVLAEYKLTGRVITITSDNASSNGVMVSEINKHLEDAFQNRRFLDGTIQQIPCLAHIIQLAVKALLGKIRLRPSNETFIRAWKEDQELDDLTQIKVAAKRGLPFILAKVRIYSCIYTNLYTNLDK